MRMLVVLAAVLLLSFPAIAGNGDVVVENGRFRLVVGADAIVKSLVVKPENRECIVEGMGMSMFAAMQDRPFDNEMKLSEPTRRTTYPAVSLRREGDMLIAGFCHGRYEAVIRLRSGDGYAAFHLEGFRCRRTDSYSYLKMDLPPVSGFGIMRLPVRERKHFGSWLNVSWDENAAVALVGVSAHADVSGEKQGSCRVLRADLSSETGMKGYGAAIVAASGKEEFLDAMDAFEDDFRLPRGVRSRRRAEISESIFHVYGSAPLTKTDELVAYAQQGGFRLMTFSDGDVSRTMDSWQLHGDYDWREDFPKNENDLKAVLSKLKKAGIRPGFHTLHSHIGLKSRYATPVADARLNKKCRFTLAADMSADDEGGTLDVLERTHLAPASDGCRVLQFGGELLTYESVDPCRPGRFCGIRRGAFGTHRQSHRRGTVGGILDVSEYGLPGSCYIDQNTDLQDEVADKLARFYNCGFEYVYLDGSEGVHRPFAFHVANAQYRYWKKLRREPLFGEAAAKSHFSWHMLAGANAFDCFEPERFKMKLREHPLKQAPRTWQDFTRVNFGWWCLYLPDEKSTGTQLDMWEYGMSLASAWDGAVSAMMSVETLREHPRSGDILEMMRRWNDMRRRGLLKAEWKEQMRNGTKEHHLFVNGKGEYELAEIAQIAFAGRLDGDVRAFGFVRAGRSYVMFWDVRGERDFVLDIPPGELAIASGPDGAGENPDACAHGSLLKAGNLRYLSAALPMDRLVEAFRKARVQDGKNGKGSRR